jgi:hypothetical protein
MFYLTEVKSICNVVEVTGETKLLEGSRAWALVEDLHHLWVKSPPTKFETNPAQQRIVQAVHKAWERGNKLLK